MRYPAPDWKVAALTHRDIVHLKLLLAGWALWRSADYASAAGVEEVGALEKTLPLEFWVLACWLVSLLIFTGVAARRHRIVFAGHIMGMIVYPALTVSAVVYALRGWPPARELIVHAVSYPGFTAACIFVFAGPLLIVALQRRLRESVKILAIILAFVLAAIVSFSAPLSEARAAGPLVTISVLHFLFALRSGRVPMEDDDSEVEESIVSPSGS